MLGEFNAHPRKQQWLKLQQYCDKYWIYAETEFLGLDSGTITFISDIDGSRRWLDHCVVTKSAWTTILNIKVKSEVQWSDHFPLIMQCKLGACDVKPTSKVIWHTRSNTQIKQYLTLIIMD